MRRNIFALLAVAAHALPASHASMYLQCGKFRLSLARPLIMGIVNVTPDSFSDGGSFATASTALAHARRLVDEGADLIDIGGESTRPGAGGVALEEERRRVLPVLEHLPAALSRSRSIRKSPSSCAKRSRRAHR